MSSIDQRIVQMRFDNAGFKTGVSGTMSSLSKLTDSLKMKGATKGLSDVDRGLKNLGTTSMTPLNKGIETVMLKFNQLEIVTASVMSNIANRAVDAAGRLAKSWTLEPIMTGFQEYETKMNAITTILTNTASKGTTMKDVTAALDELNVYADKTIYNFAEMTKNIGAFTAAGIDLDVAVGAIKGIANLGAGSGSSPQQVATAMYQLSQAMAAGKVSLMDWNSVVNAGMGGELFQNALKQTAKDMGIFVDESIPFRNSLEDGWLTSDVLANTLNTFAEDKSLQKAATEVKTLTGLLGTMKETLQSGWAKSFEFIFGNKEDAAALFTSISNGFNSIVGPSADARNSMLEFWNEAGGRDDVIAGLNNIIQSVGKGLKAIGEAFKNVFPPMTGKTLTSLSKGFLELTENFKMSDRTANMIKNTFEGLFSIVKIGVDAFKAFLQILNPVGGLLGGLGKLILTGTDAFGRFVKAISDGISEIGLFEMVISGFEAGFGIIENVVVGAADAFDFLINAISSLNFQPVLDFFGELAGGVGTGVMNILEGIGGMIGKIDFNHIMGALGAILAGKGLKTIKDIGSNFSDMFENISSVGDSISGILNGVKDSLMAYQNDLNAGALLKIAAAIGILSLSISTISGIETESLYTALAGITILFVELIASLAILMKVAAGVKMKGFFGLSTGMVAISASILLLANALKQVSGLSWDEIIRGLVGVTGSMALLIGATKLLAGTTGGLIKTGAAMIIIAQSINVLADAVAAFGSIPTDELIRGLVGVGVALAELSLFMMAAKFGGLGMSSAASILVLSAALNVLADAVSAFGSLDIPTLAKGLGSVALILAQIALFSKVATGGMGLMATSTALVIMAGGLIVMSEAINRLGSVPIETIGKGLLSMAGSLTVLAAASMVLSGSKLAMVGAGLVVMSAGLTLLSHVLKTLGSLKMDEIGRAMIALGGALGVLAIGMMAMSAGMAGAMAMMAMSAALMLFTPQLLALSQLSLPQLGIGLLAVAGAFAILGGAGLLLTPVIPMIISLAGAIALIGLGASAAGVGISLFSTGLATLVAVGGAGGLALVELLRQLIGLLPTFGSKLAEMFTNFLTTLTTNIPLIVEGLGQLITAFIDAFTKALPAIADSALALITTIAETIIKAVPMLLETGVTVILAILEGITSNLYKIGTAAIDMVLEFINVVSSNLGRVIDAGIKLAIDFINGVANGIRSNSGAVTDAVLNLIDAVIMAIAGSLGKFVTKGGEIISKLVQGAMALIGKCAQLGKKVVSDVIKGVKGAISSCVQAGKDIINGFIKGVKSMASSLVSAAKGVVKGAIDGAKNLLGINSPSKVFAKFGFWTVKGFTDGLDKNAKNAGRSGRNLADQAIESMRKPINSISKLLDGKIDSNPTIRPVMDLSSINKGTKTLKDILAINNTVGINTNTPGKLSNSIQKIQNGSDNSDIVSELRKMQKTLSGINRPSYSIGNVGYNNDNGVADAIEVLINAATVGGRI